jgi:hypothetical protein
MKRPSGCPSLLARACAQRRAAPRRAAPQWAGRRRTGPRVPRLRRASACGVGAGGARGARGTGQGGTRSRRRDNRCRRGTSRPPTRGRPCGALACRRHPRSAAPSAPSRAVTLRPARAEGCSAARALQGWWVGSGAALSRGEGEGALQGSPAPLQTAAAAAVAGERAPRA